MVFVMITNATVLMVSWVLTAIRSLRSSTTRLTPHSSNSPLSPSSKQPSPPAQNALLASTWPRTPSSPLYTTRTSSRPSKPPLPSAAMLKQQCSSRTSTMRVSPLRSSMNSALHPLHSYMSFKPRMAKPLLESPSLISARVSTVRCLLRRSH